MTRTPIALMAMLALVSCAGPQYGSVQTVSASSLATPNGADGAYRLGPGDKLKITVYGEENLSSEQQVGPDGSVTVPLIGAVKATGRSAPDVSDEIRNKLGEGFVRSPSVSVTIEQYRPFYILGEVNTPGQYEYAQGMTVLAAVARAGGYTYRANKNEIFLKREGNAEELHVRLDSDIPIRPGDTIRIGERYF
ncbi:MAG: polysaccharide biosynthesis/export family protein [Sphingomonas sp.]|jgi:polysaccharide export outer membrane protein